MADELAWLDSAGAGEPGADRQACDRRPTDFDFVLLFSLRYHTAFHAARAARRQGRARADHRARSRRSASQMFGPVLRGVARHHVQLAGGAGAHRDAAWQPESAGRHRGRRLARSRSRPTRRARAAAFGLDRPVRRLRRPHRRQQGLCRAVRLLHALLRAATIVRSTWC